MDDGVEAAARALFFAVRRDLRRGAETPHGDRLGRRQQPGGRGPCRPAKGSRGEAGRVGERTVPIRWRSTQRSVPSNGDCPRAPAAQQAWSAEAHGRLCGRVTRLPPFWARPAADVEKGATPSEVVYEEDRLQLLRYVGDGPPKYKTPLVFVFALVNRPYILDILPNKSVVRHFVDAGFDTYLVDWGVATHADRHHSLDDLRQRLPRQRRRFRVRADRLAADEHPGLLHGRDDEHDVHGPVSGEGPESDPPGGRHRLLVPARACLNLWTDPRYFDVDAFVDAFGNAPAEFLQSAFRIAQTGGELLRRSRWASGSGWRTRISSRSTSPWRRG